MARFLLSAVASVLLAGSLPAAAQILEARTTAGIVRGEPAGTITQFKGIPYAAPPTGELRWRAPQPPVPWTGVRRTTRFGAGCMQDPQLATAMGMSVPLSEDCLFIDVWTPADAPTRALPVLVWIYGGGYNSGATSVPIYDGAQFARQGVVVVSIAYRVGPFGFLATPELTAEGGGASGEYGLLDLVAGLQWVRDNVAQFGGDAAKVTIMGHSAGSAAVSSLVVSPLAHGLFRGAIAQSGASFEPPADEARGGRTRTPKLAESQGQAWLATALNVRTLAEARALPATRLDEAQRAAGAPRFAPPIGGKVIPGDLVRLWEAGRFEHVPLLIGSTSDETAAFGPRKQVSVADFERQVREGYGDHAASVLKTYPHGTDAEATRSAKNLASESGIVWNAMTFARLQRQYGNVPVYGYWFHNPTATNTEGSGHGSEVALVFGNQDARPGRAPWSPQDRALSWQLQNYWVNFATNGDPNGPGLPAWPKFDPAKPTVLQLGAQIRTMPLPVATRLKALDAYYSSVRGN